MNDNDPYTKLVSKLKRGNGTRDQDTTKIVTKHPDPEQAVENHEDAIEHATQFADNARAVDPGGDTDE